ncbi:pyridoxal kinase [Nocardioides limicola]|uniref:pyridoxal kinase n=1 Tax=Nocardioides limicola TaxID=2803368 RepID=UPI00193BBBF6|nr:pyridoxal kinase [Nocardioides sp. DJM-14]
MRVLSIQSQVSYGYVGNTVATFVLQRLGHQVCAVPTVCYSNHTGYPGWRGHALTPAQVRDLIDGLDDLDALAEIDLVLTGYLGDPSMVAVVAETVDRVRAANPAARYACDPVLGDTDSGLYVPAQVPDQVATLLIPAADLVIPNRFELGVLTGHPTDSLAATLVAADLLRDAGPTAALVTSVVPEPDPGLDDGTVIGMLAVTGSGAWLVETPQLPGAFPGAGDLTAALAVARWYVEEPASVLASTASGIHAVVAASHAAGSSELWVVEAQQAFVEPGREFAVHRVR